MSAWYVRRVTLTTSEIPMSDRFNPGRLGDWVVFCDICGQKCYASETTKLSTYTGQGNAIVCKYDVDAIDYGLVPFIIPVEKPVPWTRSGDLDVPNEADPINYETATNIGG
jgi:hypothetical protein